MIGACEGPVVGLCDDGEYVGFTLGSDVIAVGDEVGGCDGRIVGLAVGSDEGNNVGLVVGDLVGLNVGEVDGDGVGALQKKLRATSQPRSFQIPGNGLFW